MGICYNLNAMNVARNTVIMLVGSIGQKLISLAYFAFLARWFLSKGELGDYTAALAFSTLFVVFIDLGMNNLLIRDGAQNQKQLSTLATQILAIKILTGLIAYIALIITGLLNGFDRHFITLISITGLAMILDATHLTFYGFLRATGKLEYEASSMAGSQLLTMAIGLIGLFLGAKVLFLLFTFVLTSLANVIFSYSRAKKHGLVLTFKGADFVAAKKLLQLSWPFALALIFGRFYSYSDVVLLKILRGSEEVAVYSTPSKISFAFQFIPLAFMAALYPRLSSLAKENTVEFKKLLSLSIKYLLLVAVPISAGIFILAEPIMVLAFSKNFLSSVPSLRILIFSLIFSFISFPLGAALNASGHERRQTWLTGFTLLANIIANLIFIPIYGASGAAYAALIGNLCLGTFGFFLLPNKLNVDWKILWPVIVKLFLVTATMSAVVWQTFHGSNNNLLVAIISGGLTFVITVALTGLIKLSEIKNLRLKGQIV